MPNVKPPVGSQVKVRSRLVYAHHGVTIGDGWVVHFSSSPLKKLLNRKAIKVMMTSLDDFCDGAKWKVVNHRNPCSAAKAVQRAKMGIGYSNYNLLRDNCETFARWCTTNDPRTLQVLGWRRPGGGKGYNKKRKGSKDQPR